MVMPRIPLEMPVLLPLRHSLSVGEPLCDTSRLRQICQFAMYHDRNANCVIARNRLQVVCQACRRLTKVCLDSQAIICGRLACHVFVVLANGTKRLLLALERGLPRMSRLTQMPLFHKLPSLCLQHNSTHLAMPASADVTTGCLLTT